LAVKRSQSASRVLSIFELISAHQPIGVSALAKLLDDDRSAVQRGVMTLADAGWIRLAPEPPVRWELSAHIFTMAHLPDSMTELRQRARPILEGMREQTGETVFLAIPDLSRFVIIESADSHHTLRMALRVGQVIGPRESATGRAFLPYLDSQRQAEMLGHAPDAKDLAEFAATRERGYGLSAGDVMPGATNLAAAIFGPLAEPIAALVVSGPSDRLTPERHDAIGRLVAQNAATLSRGNAMPAVPRAHTAQLISELSA
jgi:DNA-binding IclR family transcriptional regulator